MKKVFTFIVLCSLIFQLSTCLFPACASTANQHSRAIHVVFDDSGSMIRDNNQYVDRWCQAKYALEVFAAMLEENDIMQVYYMSDFDTSAGGNVSAPARIAIAGSESAETRVSKIHDTVTGAGNTPFDPVVKAYGDLKSSNADDKWLVVLTDGQFNRLNGRADNNIDVDYFFSQYVSESEVKIMLLAMADNAAEIKSDPGRGIYFEQARDNKDILGKITTICNRIFNRNKLSLTNETRKEFSFDIPMDELFVFAQGDNVKINGVSGDRKYSPNSSVSVRYSETATTNINYDRSQVKIASDLTGVVASFKDMPKGSYSLDISGAQTVEIYYKPNVALDIKLYQNGDEVITQNFNEGEYQIRYGIIDENGSFFESSLLGKVEYTATARNGGRTYAVNSGDTIILESGDFTLDVLADFLGINTAENTITRRITATSPLDIDIVIPNNDFSVSNLINTDEFVITAKHQGGLLSESQWLSMPLPVITTDAKVDITEISRGSSVSTFLFYVRPKDGDKFITSTGEIDIDVSLEIMDEDLHSSGESTVSINITDDNSLADKILAWFQRYKKKILISLILFVLILGYIPPIKKYLPKRLARRPAVDCSPNKPGIKAISARGKYQKDILSTIIPYKAEKGTIKYTPPGVAAPVLKVRGAGGNGMFITNVKDFAGKDHIRFDGVPVEKDKSKPMRKGSGVVITVNNKDMKYTCAPAKK